MLFFQLQFFLFFFVVFVLAWRVQGHSTHKVLLLVASYFFYACWDWRFLSLIMVSTAVDYIAARKVDSAPNARRRRIWLIVSLIINLGILGTFKYFNFFADSAAALLSTLGMKASWTTLTIVLPVGISFYTFQTMSYTIDVYRKRMDPCHSLLDVAVFVSFFPQLVAGPIIRAHEFLPQLKRRPVWRVVNVRACLMLFLLGFFKKVCLSDNIAPFVDQFQKAPELYATASAWTASLLYTVQIYCDFSGYSDMAIASAGLLGYTLPINFNFPYLARNVTEFWARWHISLSTWLRDYVYLALGASRSGTARTLVCLAITMLLGGLWHGAAWTFVAFGALHGFYLVLHRVIGSLPLSGSLTFPVHIAGVFITYRRSRDGD